ncbi:hypothetical protein [Fundidesulfovibrio agrisoli]|uniref:hypothetical protein n=1 Tax=Fundidesulfovibrio agrisoli TaxID=2922717 RepID=UPI001FACA2EC|nr:hypothetical protein [Fundidesulfovibrio agrisoli]
MDVLVFLFVLLIAGAVYHLGSLVSKEKLDIEQKIIEIRTIESIRHLLSSKRVGNGSSGQVQKETSAIIATSAMEGRGRKASTDRSPRVELKPLESVKLDNTVS